MFNKELIAKMKKGVLIVNNARGAIMDTQAVVDACSSGHIGGTCTIIFVVVNDQISCFGTLTLQNWLEMS